MQSILAAAFLLALLSTTASSAKLPDANLLGARATDLAGTVHVLGGRAERQPVALVFVSVECPVSNRYVTKLGELAGQAARQDVAFYGVLSDPRLTVAQIKTWVDEYSVGFPLLVDGSGDLARRLEPTHVPEAFVISEDDELLYRGRIDDGFVAIGRPRAQTTRHDLAEAIAAATGPGKVAEPRTEPVGCLFEAWDDDALASSVTYTRDIAPLLNANCVECHRAGEVAPFALDSYESAKKRARMIALVCEEKIMPPWRAEVGEWRFRNERHLSKRDLALLQAWAQAGAPRGDEAQLLPAPSFGRDGWRLGEPDLVVTMPEAFPVPADGPDIYRNFVIPLGLDTDKMVVAAEFRPGAPAVVHHALFHLDNSGRARQMEAADPEPGYGVFNGESPGFWPSGSVGGWSPGAQPYFISEGFGMELEANEDLVLEVHYHPNGKPALDQSTLALWFTDEPVLKADAHPIGTEQVDIPAGESDYWRHVWIDLPLEVALLDITPHAHYLGKEFYVDVTMPDGELLSLLSVPDYDFRWQDSYIFAEPVILPAGARINARIRYDNSAANPANPSNPPVRVTEGWQTTDEMCLVYMTIVPEDEARRGELVQAIYASFSRDATLRE